MQEKKIGISAVILHCGVVHENATRFHVTAVSTKR